MSVDQRFINDLSTLVYLNDFFDKNRVESNYVMKNNFYPLICRGLKKMDQITKLLKSVFSHFAKLFRRAKFLLVIPLNLTKLLNNKDHT